MSRNKTIEQKDQGKIRYNWNDEVELSDEYARYREWFLPMIIEFQDIVL